MARHRAQVVIHTFSDSDSSSNDGGSAAADSVSSVVTDYDSYDNVDEDLLNDNLDPVFQWPLKYSTKLGFSLGPQPRL